MKDLIDHDPFEFGLLLSFLRFFLASLQTVIAFLFSTREKSKAQSVGQIEALSEDLRASLEHSFCKPLRDRQLTLDDLLAQSLDLLRTGSLPRRHLDCEQILEAKIVFNVANYALAALRHL